jgi:hypothetical protein
MPRGTTAPARRADTAPELGRTLLDRDAVNLTAAVRQRARYAIV